MEVCVKGIMVERCLLSRWKGFLVGYDDLDDFGVVDDLVWRGVGCVLDAVVNLLFWCLGPLFLAVIFLLLALLSNTLLATVRH